MESEVPIPIYTPLYSSSSSDVFAVVVGSYGHVVKMYMKTRLTSSGLSNVKREAAIMRGLQHPHIISYITDIETRHVVGIVQEYAEYGDLHNLLRSCNKFDEGFVLRFVAIPILEVLVYLHSKSIIHRDIKPENIMIAKGYIVKLGDFGSAINTKYDIAVHRVGTSEFMSPEINKLSRVSLDDMTYYKRTHQHLYNHKVDVWSLGVTLYELLFGYVPVPKFKDAGSSRRSISFPDYPNVSTHAKRFILACLVDDPSIRPDAKDLLQHPWIVSSLQIPTILPLLPPSHVPTSVDVQRRSPKKSHSFNTLPKPVPPKKGRSSLPVEVVQSAHHKAETINKPSWLMALFSKLSITMHQH